MKLLLSLSLLLLSTIQVQAGELDGICNEENTASSCTVINNTGKTIRKIEWILEGSWVDYGNEASLELKPGANTKLHNPSITNNCLFTEYTWLIVRTIDNERFEYFDDGTISFDSQGQCTIELK